MYSFIALYSSEKTTTCKFQYIPVNFQTLKNTNFKNPKRSKASTSSVGVLQEM